MAAEQIHGEHYDRNPISYDVIMPCLLASENALCTLPKTPLYVCIYGHTSKAGYCCCCRFDILSAAERVVRADRERQESTLVKVDTH